MSDLNVVGTRDGWRCWICDKPVDPDASVNSDLGPSVDSFGADRGKKSNSGAIERLAHRQCNTMKGKKAPVVPWGEGLFIADPAPIIETVARLQSKGGREVVGRCPDKSDAKAVEEWLIDRLSRLAPDGNFSVEIKEGGGQYLIALRAN
jgi:hypothetical protein